MKCENAREIVDYGLVMSEVSDDHSRGFQSELHSPSEDLHVSIYSLKKRVEFICESMYSFVLYELEAYVQNRLFEPRHWLRPIQ